MFCSDKCRKAFSGATSDKKPSTSDILYKLENTKLMDKTKKAMDFQKYLTKRLKDPKFSKYYNEYGKQLEIAYQILQLRKLGTTQCL